jgi:hypothetical protein
MIDAPPTIASGRGEFPYERGKHLIVASVMHTFGDESGIERNATYCIIAGYIAAPKQWAKFRRQWRRILRKYHVPEFHAWDFYQPERRKRTEHYHGWSEEKECEFLAALLRTINECDIRPIGVAIHVPSFNAFDHDERRYLSGGLLATHAFGHPDGSTVVLKEDFKSSGAPSRPYMAIFQRFVGEALLKAPSKTTVHFTFDIQNLLAPRAIETFHEQFKSGHLPPHLEAKAGTIRYAKSIEEEPLQAADLCAYFWNRELNKSVRGRLLRQTAEAFAVKSHCMTVFNREHLQKILDSTLDDAVAQIKRVQERLGHGQQE